MPLHSLPCHESRRLSRKVLAQAGLAVSLALAAAPDALAVGGTGCTYFPATPNGKLLASGTPAQVDAALRDWLDFRIEQAKPSRILGFARQATAAEQAALRTREALSILEGTPGATCDAGPLLRYAVGAGNTPVVRYLLDKPLGVEPAVDKDILFQCEGRPQSTDAAPALRRAALAAVIDAGKADVNGRKNDEYPIRFCRDPRIASLLIARGARLAIPFSGSSPAQNLVEDAVLAATAPMSRGRREHVETNLQRVKLFAAAGVSTKIGAQVERRVKWYCHEQDRATLGEPDLCKELAGLVQLTPGTLEPSAAKAPAASAAMVPFAFPAPPPPKPVPAPLEAPYQFPRGQTPAPAQSCSFMEAELPPDTIVVVAGGYAGRRLPFQIDQSGSQATQFDIAVHADKPVALVLGAYDPTIWSVGWSEGTRIVAVFATGYHRQAVAGLPKGTPVITTSYEPRGACGYRYFNEGASLDSVNSSARQAFRRNATSVYTKARGGRIEITESTRPLQGYVTSPDTPPESFRDRAAPQAGKPGLQDAQARGILRPVAPSDIEVVRAHFRATAGQAGPPRPELLRRLEDGYVVMKPFAYPAGLFGAHSSAFIIGKGVAPPTGSPGHSTVVDLNAALPCSGVLCR